MKKIIRTTEQYFFDEDIKYIIDEFKKILKNRKKLTMGEFVKKFEKNFAKFIDTKYAVATSSGTSALEIILKSLKIGDKDEVIVPSQTYIATASSVMNVGAKPVFSEINDNFLIDFNNLKKLINKKTRAVIIVHYGGLIHEEIFKIKKYLSKKKIFLIEDAAHAHGASIKNLKAGNLSDAAAFSFYSSKIITTCEGGIITTNNKKIFQDCSSFRSRGLDINNKKEVYSNLGSNYRVTEIQALIGLTQLKRLNYFIKHRVKISKIYEKNLYKAIKDKKIRIIKSSKNIINPHWKYTVFLLKEQNRSKIKKELEKKFINIDWAYEPLVHLQPLMKKKFNNKKGMLPNSEKLARTHINLPIHYNVSLKEAKYIVKKLIKLL